MGKANQERVDMDQTEVIELKKGLNELCTASLEKRHRLLTGSVAPCIHAEAGPLYTAVPHVAGAAGVIPVTWADGSSLSQR